MQNYLKSCDLLSRKQVILQIDSIQQADYETSWLLNFAD